jgi:hypothetical protein
MSKVSATLISLRNFAVKMIKAYHPAIMYGKLSLIKRTFISFLLPLIVWLFHHHFHFKISPVLDITSWVLGR